MNSMSKEMIHGYELLSPFQNKDAGYCRWTFARKENKTYFIKELMDPKYPDAYIAETVSGQNMIRACQDFEKKYRKFYERIGRAADGNIQYIHELFRNGSRYYIVTEQVKDALTMGEILSCSLEERLFLCRGLAHSLESLHNKKVVHSDIKESNIMVKHTKTGKLAGKIIDFESAFLEEEPPLSEDGLAGDPVYLSPEACRFINGHKVKLSTKMDVFSMGMLFHRILTGRLPGFDTKKYNYLHEAVLEGQCPYLHFSLPLELQRIIAAMLARDAQFRLSSAQVYSAFANYDRFLPKDKSGQVYPDYRDRNQTTGNRFVDANSSLHTGQNSGKIKGGGGYFHHPGNL